MFPLLREAFKIAIIFAMCMTHVTYSQWSKNSSGEGTKKCLKMGTFDLLILD